MTNDTLEKMGHRTTQFNTGKDHKAYDFRQK